MADNEIKVQITADDSGLEEALSGTEEQIEALAAQWEALAGSTTVASDALEDIAAVSERVGDGLSEGSEATSEWGETLERVGETAASIFLGVGLYEAVGKIREAFEEATFGAAEWAEELNNTALATGISADKLQTLQQAAALSGTNAERLTFMMSTLTRRLDELDASAGNNKIKQLFSADGIDPAKLRDSSTALDTLVDAVNRLGAGSPAIHQLFDELFGRAGLQAIPLINALAQTRAGLAELGLSIDKDGREKLEQFALAWNETKLTSAAALKEIGVALAPLGTELLQVGLKLTLGFQGAGEQVAAVLNFINDEASVLGKEVGEILRDAFTDWEPIAKGVLDIYFGALKQAAAVVSDLAHGDFAGAGEALLKPLDNGLSVADQGVAKITAAWKKGTADGAADFQKMIDAEKKATDDLATHIKGINDLANIKPPELGAGAGAVKLQPANAANAGVKEASQAFENLRAQYELDEAAAKDDADKKIEIAQAFVEKVRGIANLPLKDELSAYAEEERAYQSYIATKQRVALEGVANEETVGKAGLALANAQSQQELSQATQAAQLRLAGGQESRLQELTDQQQIDAARTVEARSAVDREYQIILAGLEQQLAIYEQYPQQNLAEIAKIDAQIQAENLSHWAKMTEISTKGAEEAAKAAVQATAEQTKQINDYYQTLLEPISRAFDQSFTGVIQGTQRVSQAFRKMGEDIALSLARSGIQDLLLGGAKGSAGASLFGTSSGGFNIASALKEAVSGIFGGAGGAAGAPGSPGIPSAAGLPGAAGLFGAAGLPGAASAPGLPGAPGESGAPGAPGAPGGGVDSGLILSGLKGVFGSLTGGAGGAGGAGGGAGASGLPGAAGAPGASGAAGGSTTDLGILSREFSEVKSIFGGVFGGVGATGTPGAPGTPGIPGLPGAPGLAGVAGAAGTPGAAGDEGGSGNLATLLKDALGGIFGGPTSGGGTPGAPSLPGLPGAPGLPGDAGVAGTPGLPGAPGLPGLAGAPGASGGAGESASGDFVSAFKDIFNDLLGRFGGAPGEPGVSGVPGAAGVPGLPGEPGIAGLPGLPGLAGLAGEPGAAGGAGESASGVDLASALKDVFSGLFGGFGEPGVPGTPGLPGAPGLAGVAGAAAVGLPGAPGAAGAPGGVPEVSILSQVFGQAFTTIRPIIQGEFGQVFTANKPIIQTVFGEAWTGLQAIIRTVFGTALRGGASAVAGAGASAVAGAGVSAVAGAASQAPTIATMTANTVAMTALTAAVIANTAAVTVETTEQIASAAASGAGIVGALSEGGIVPEHFAQGGIVPQGFAKGGIVPPSYFAQGGIVAMAAQGMIAHGTDTVPAMLTPGEMVLPRHISTAVQNFANNYNNVSTPTVGESGISDELAGHFAGMREDIGNLAAITKQGQRDLVRTIGNFQRPIGVR